MVFRIVLKSTVLVLFFNFILLGGDFLSSSIGDVKPKVKPVRTYSMIVYPHSAYPDWLQRLDDLHIPALVSPLHDLDLKENGVLKDPHYHVMFVFDGKKSKEDANSYYRSFVGDDGFVGFGVVPVASTRSYARYLCHLDNPDKHLYNSSDVIAFGGADYNVFLCSGSDKYLMYKMIAEFIKDYEVTSFIDFFNYCSEHNEAWFQLLCDSGTYVIRELIKSNSWDLKSDN